MEEFSCCWISHTVNASCSADGQVSTFAMSFAFGEDLEAGVICLATSSSGAESSLDSDE